MHYCWDRFLYTCYLSFISIADRIYDIIYKITDNSEECVQNKSKSALVSDGFQIYESTQTSQNEINENKLAN